MLLMSLVLQGCQPVLTTTSFEDPAASSDRDTGVTCRNSAGAYALPRHVLKFDVTKTEPDATNGTPARYDIGPITVVAEPDPDRIYCLDFIASALAEDKVHVEREPATDEAGSLLLLKQISTSNNDQTLDIANQIVDAAASVAAASIAGNRGAVDVTADKKYVIARYEVDPFDHAAMVRTNAALDKLDHCVFLDPMNDPYVPDWENEFCSGYRPAAAERFPYYGLEIIDSKPPPRSAGANGVLYKPLLTHKLVTMKRNHDPVGAPWQLFGSQRVAMANASPAFMLEIQRSAFVQRQMTIDFDAGVLRAVKVVKPSEADALAGFVLRTAQVIVSIPVRALVIGQTDAKNRTALIAAQAQLLETIRAYNDEVGKQTKGDDKTTGGDNNSQRSTARSATAVATTGSLSYDACIQNSILINPDEDPAAVCAGLVASGGQ
ncbi:hypothetical protein FJ936_13475 [Mesorhizobium sp. B2-4-13]|uniref:hypothetical protein n=1 Tax=Mesorhizobium sp. B2-4-13 TaxID=2589936 RepID=UPI0011535651|nr:hypothetical protein [Mesorhizobium sp. B2-4-13]TPK84882.1 hypothetical protein FJ936_13475 [Mesorhizobium sp. B2-4-13]